jgi:hypothetical protein
MMHGREKSDSAIVAGKPTNKAVSTAAEPVERRAEAKGNASQQSTRRTQSRVSVSQALERIRQAVTKNALPSHTQGGSRMPELGPYGSVRGALSNERPYRDLRNVVAKYPFERSNRFPGILHSMLQPREDRCNLILELQTPLLEPCENLVGGRLFPRLDAIDISVDFVVALRESPELIIGSYHPLDKRDLLRKLIS